MMKHLRTVSLTAVICGLAPLAHAGTENPYQSDAELAMVEDKPKPQAGQLTAGDYDDILNPELFKAYVDKMLQGKLKDKKLPYVDANNRINIRVVDNQGKVFPLADVSLKDSAGENVLPLRTTANGMSYLYPNYDDLKSGHILSVSSDSFDEVQTTLTQDLIENGGNLTIPLGTRRTPIDKLDLLLTIDATGSMGDELKYLQSELEAIVSRVETSNPDVDIRHSLVVYRDKGDDYVVRDFPFTGDIEAFKTSLNAQVANGGGDMPEAMHTAMQVGLKMKWREEALKVNLLVADAPPHDKDISETWETGSISRSRGIHIVSLSGSGVDKTAEFIMRGMSQMTNGRYLFLTDDSGIGNAHAEPTVDCYVATRLDGLVTRVLNSLITGEREEPKDDDIIRRTGNYQSGVCAADIEIEANPKVESQ